MQGILKQINSSNGGLPKWAITGPVMLTRSGVQGDRQADLRHHGGPYKAILLIAAEIVDELIARGFPLFYGALGENLTISGLDPGLWRMGQRYRIGPDAEIELTTLRVPCSNLNVYGPMIKGELYDAQCKAGDITSPHWTHGGFYARIVRPGLIFAGAPVTLQWDIA